MAIKTISGITIMGTVDNFSYDNSKNSSHFSVNNHEVSYRDSFGNYMTSSPCHIRINFEHFKLKEMGDEIRISDGRVMIMMPRKQIQEIANKTFYAEEQFHAINFLTFEIIEENK